MLKGRREEGTDAHSFTARILGISREQAKIFNYGRIYGAGLAFAKLMLQQFSPSLSEQEASHRAHEVYKRTKGIKRFREHLATYEGGSYAHIYGHTFMGKTL